MKVRTSKRFDKILQKTVDFIARDKPEASRKFFNDVIDEIHTLNFMPFRYRKSRYYNDENIRDMTFRGYCITYKIQEEKDLVTAIGLRKNQERP